MPLTKVNFNYVCVDEWENIALREGMFTHIEIKQDIPTISLTYH